jgi:hypothetical protein
MCGNFLSQFGQHPDYSRACRLHLQSFKKGEEKFPFGNRIDFKDFFKPLHPDVCLIPRNKPIFLVDEYDEPVELLRTAVPFSSYDFFTDWAEGEGMLNDLADSAVFHRLGNISQLGYLVLPASQGIRNKIIYYTMPQFSHTRWLHSILTAQLAQLILSRNGFSLKEMAPIVLTAGSHDIAMPAGGDSSIRINRQELSEEKNYSLVLEANGLSQKWKNLYGFDLQAASAWVRNEGVIGFFINIIDRMSYTALDACCIGKSKNGAIRSFIRKNPLVMDMWQNLKFSSDREIIYFDDPEKLYLFLYLRALEHEELLYNPRTRCLDFFLTEYAGRLYRDGVITKNDFLTRDDKWLEYVLAKYFPDKFQGGSIAPGKMQWRKFKNEKDLANFQSKLPKKCISHAEYLKQLHIGLDWPVMINGSICELRKAIPSEKVEALENIAKKLQGWVLYYFNEI